MAVIAFPNTPTTAAQGLAAFRKLREYRRLHETQWDTELRERAKNKAEFNVPYTTEEIKAMNKQEKKAILKKRKKALGKILQDQKANTVADMAAVLATLDFIPKVEEKVVPEKATAKGATAKGKETVDPSKTKAIPEKKKSEAVVKPEDGTAVEKTGKEAKAGKEAPVKEPIPEVPGEIRAALDEVPIRVHWKNILDAEYAEKWPLGVLHYFMDPMDILYDFQTILADNPGLRFTKRPAAEVATTTTEAAAVEGETSPKQTSV